MKRILFVSACVLAMSAGGAFAQNQPAPGASSKGNVGPGVTHHRMHHMTSSHRGMAGTTTGMAPTRRHQMGSSSSEGNVGPGTNNNNGPQPGGR
jgi:hypothetical protein